MRPHPPRPAQRPPPLVAVIDLGSSAFRLMVAEVLPEGGWRVLDSAERPVALGRDVFVTGQIGPATMAEALQVLAGFAELLVVYPVDRVVAVGTSALREAQNRDLFVDRARRRTGIQVRVIDGLETSRLTYLVVRHALRAVRPALSRGNALIMEIGSGSTEVMLLERGRMAVAHSLPLGTIRLGQQYAAVAAASLGAFVRENVRSTVDLLAKELELRRVDRLIAVGSDARLAAERLARRRTADYAVIAGGAFRQFVRGLEPLNPERIAARLNLSYLDAEPLLPALLSYALFLDATAAREVIVPMFSLREGLLLDQAPQAAGLPAEFHRQSVAGATRLLRKYAADEPHARQVRDLALALFDALSDDHGLGARERLQLEVAALLHDLGTFVNAHEHHAHGQYIIAHSDLFGLDRDDVAVVGNVVRYHRRERPDRSHVAYAVISREQRLAVLKLAALLRVADALDRSHRRRIPTVALERTADELLIHARSRSDLNLERQSLKQKADLFEEVFGRRVSLR